ncbi:hypothetical protein [Lactiplantibacillus plajomi]|uniref:Uncharacterized protein n=1 Tax=Lactiplantibacillus plajomi TaxID=1457217 RepID=A0ABV6K4W1_9LACO|nr:hypothetical protein [Lactiplantibacillus plajomi]
MEQLPRRPVLLAKLKALRVNEPENAAYDVIMDYVLDKTIADVANYCHLAMAELPEELDNTMIAMCLQLISTHQLLTPLDERSGDVDSISEGDTSVKFKSASQAYLELQEVNTISDNFVLALNAFRKVKR